MIVSAPSGSNEAAGHRSHLEDLVLLGSLAVTLVVAWKFIDYAYDDAYITFRYARNIVDGNGFVYNLEHNFLGTTTPFYTLLLAFLGFAIEIPLAAGLVSIASLLGCIGVIDRIGRDSGVRFAGAAAALFLSTNVQVYQIFGGETLLVYFLLVPLAYHLDLRGHTIPAAVLFGLAILCRMDAGLFVALYYTQRTMRDRWPPVRDAVIVAATLIPWFAYSWVVFGSPFPSTLAAKIAQGDSGGWNLFLKGGLGDLARLPEYAAGLAFVFVPIAVLGLYRITRHERVWAIFVVNSLLFAVAYQFVLGVSYSHWYLANVYVTNGIVLGAGIRQLLIVSGSLAERWANRWADDEVARGRMRKALFTVPVLALILATGLQQYRGVAKLSSLEVMNPRRIIYTRLGQWLKENTDPSATVTYVEIGYLGWFSERTILDPVGLVTPGGLEAVRTGRFEWIFEQYRPDYYVHRSRQGTGGILAQRWFRERYHEVHRLVEAGYGGALIVYGPR